MIIKSMSRKVASFSQLIAYIDRDEGQEPYRIRHNVLGRDPERIRAEFEQNGGLLSKRKNGVYLYHEIISITRAKGLSAEEQKSRLFEIAQSYIAARCPDNLVFGGLHQDKEHSFHYHLMMSANRAGEPGRLRLTKKQFRQIQVGLENHVLEQFPELEQKVAIGKRAERKLSRGENELERRTGSRPKRDEVLERVREAFGDSIDRDSLFEALGRHDLELYVRGKNIGVIDHESGKRHRLKTLDAELADRFESRMMELSEPEVKSAPEGEKEKGAGRHERGDPNRHQAQQPKAGKKHPSPEADKDSYVKYGSNADPKSDPASQQNPNVEQDRTDETKLEREDDVSGLMEPNRQRREMIDKGHIDPDPTRDKMTHEDWREQDTFLGKVKQSVRRTFDDLRGRTKDLEEKAHGKEQTSRQAEPKAPERNSSHSEQQKNWKAEMEARREQQRGQERDGREDERKR